MPSTSSDERLHSHDIVVDLLSEARHLVVRDRAGEEDNLLQIQQAIEAAQRELRRLHFRSSVEEFRAIAAQAGLREEVGEVEQSSQEHYGTEESSDVVDGYTDDEEDGVALVTQTQNGTTASERVLGENGVENNLGSDEEARTTDEEEGSVDLMRPDIEDADPRSPSLGLSSFGPSGSTLIYTDLSRLQQTRSFIDFIDRRVGRATSSNLSDPGNILDQTPRDGDTRTIMHALRPGEEWQVTESKNDPSGGGPYTLESSYPSSNSAAISNCYFAKGKHIDQLYRYDDWKLGGARKPKRRWKKRKPVSFHQRKKSATNGCDGYGYCALFVRERMGFVSRAGLLHIPKRGIPSARK